MEEISMLEFRRNAASVIRKSREGRRMILTYRGKRVMRLEPITEEVEPDDPFYRLDRLAVANGQSLSNEEIDAILYGE